MTTTIFISIALLVVCWGIPNTNFLCGHVLCSAINFSQKIISFSFSHMDRFVEEEVEVRHIPHLSDGNLRSLCFVTIGSGQRIRSAATAWVPQVICLCSFDSHVLKKVLYKQSCKNVPTVPTSQCYFFWPVLIFGKSTRKTVLLCPLLISLTP